MRSAEPLPPMTLEQQLQMFDLYGHEAAESAINFLINNILDAHRLARERMIDGHKLYGDTMFRQLPPRLEREALEECADLINYRLPVIAARNNPTLGDANAGTGTLPR